MSLKLIFFLGLIQGITEFLPISSSGHLAMFEIFFGNVDIINQMLSFDIILHLGSLFALLIYYRKTLFGMLSGIINNDNKNKKLFYMLIIASIPAIIFGGLFGKIVEKYSHSITFISFTFFISAIYFLFAENRSQNGKTDTKIGYKQSLILGLSQALSILPGISRSGTTLATGLLIGASRKEAIDFSFLMGIPIIFAACSYLVITAGESTLRSFDTSQIAIGFFTSFAFSLFTIHFLIKFFQSHTLKGFSVYLFILSLILSTGQFLF